MTEEIVEVGRYFNALEGEIACARLRSGGLKAYLKTDNAGGIHPELNFTRGVRLMVLAADEERARDMLAQDPDAGH